MQSSQIYQFHAWLCGISPLIWRRLLVRSDQAVADLHYALQLAFGWSDFHLNTFRIHGKDFGVYHIGGPVFDEEATQVRISTSGSENGFCTSTTSGTAGSTRSGWNEFFRLSQIEPILSVLAGSDPALRRTAVGFGRFNNAAMKHHGVGRSY